MARKDDKSKKKAYSIFMLVILVVSTLGFAVVSFGDLGGDDNQNNQEQTPEKVRTYDFTSHEENRLIQGGATVMKYYYSSDCNDCQPKVGYLKTLANEQDDLFVALISTSNNEKIYASSQRNSQESEQVSNDSIEDLYCSVTPYTWDRCVIKQV